jgi:uncharacterized protein YjdB
MFHRFSARALFLAALALPFAGCSNPLVDEIAVNPPTQTVAVGQQAAFSAEGLTGHGTNHPGTVSNITDQVNWSSSSPSVATINASGVATGVSAGTTTITATINGYTGLLGATATLTVTGGGGGVGTITGITSLSVIPGSQSVQAPGATAQFIAIGTTTGGATVDLTNQVAWTSSSVQIATVNATSGLATAVGQGSDTITALYTNPGGGSTVTGTAAFSVTAGTTEQFTAVTIIPNAEELSASGQTGQFIALGTLGSNGLDEDVTNSSQIVWTSSTPSVATVAGGLATGVSVGSTTITAELKNPDGSIVSNSAQVTTTNTAAPEPLLSLDIIPGSITVGNLQDTGQFLAIGTFSVSPTVRDLTNSVTWVSSAPSVFPVNTNGTGVPNPGADAGVATAYGTGSATIIAEELDPTLTNGSIQTATAQFNCPLILPTATTAGSCFADSQAAALLSTVTVYNEGLNTTTWLVTAPSATGTPDVLHCGPGSSAAGFGGSVCVATYPYDATTATTTTITLTAPAGTGNFGGWSYNCTPTAPITAAGPNTCTITIDPQNYLTNITVGVIFN